MTTNSTEKPIPNLKGFTPLQKEIYSDINKYRWWLCTIKFRGVKTQAYLLSYGKKWSTQTQLANPLLYTHLKFGFNNKGRYIDTDETDVLLSDVISVDQAPESLEVLCEKHPCLSVLQLARSFYLSKKINDFKAEQKMLGCEYTNTNRFTDVIINRFTDVIRVVIYAVKGRTALCYPLDKVSNFNFDGKISVENLHWNTLQEIDRMETLTCDNEELRRFTKDERIIWLEQVQNKILNLISQISQDTKHINSLLHNFRTKGKNGKRILIPNDQFPALTEKIQKKAEEEIVRLDLIRKKEEFFSTLKSYEQSILSYVENYEEFGIKIN